MIEFLKNKVFSFSLLLIPIVLINATNFIVPAILLWVISSIFHFKKPIWKEVPLIIYALFLFYVLHVLGLFNTENFGYAGKDLETKLSFVLFPLVYIFTYRQLNANTIAWGKWGFILGSGLAMLHSLTNALLCDTSGTGVCYAPHIYGFQMHGTYLTAIYLFSGVLFLKWKDARWWTLILKALYVLLLFISLIYIRSLSSMVVLLVFTIILWIKGIFYFKEWWVKIVLFCIPILLLFFIGKFDHVQRDMKDTTDALESYFDNKEAFLEKYKTVSSSSGIRLVLYTFSLELMKKHPMGVGTGDVKDVLFDKFEAHDYDHFVEKKYNPHSQFFQTYIALGFFGVMLLLSLLIHPLIRMKKYAYKEMFYLAIILFISCAFESFLERQVGVIFFSFAVFLFARPQILKDNL